MTDKLREALKQIAALEPPIAVPNYRYPQKIARAALAAAPQPAPADREALVEVIRRAHGGRVDSPEDIDEACDAIADALLARGLRLQGEETMAWAVVGEDRKPNFRLIYEDRDDAGGGAFVEYGLGSENRVVRVAIRKLEGGDDAA